MLAMEEKVKGCGQHVCVCVCACVCVCMCVCVKVALKFEWRVNKRR